MLERERKNKTIYSKLWLTRKHVWEDR